MSGLAAAVRRSRWLRALGRGVPGISPAYHAARRTYLLRRGVARLDYRAADLLIGATSVEILNLRVRPVAKEPWTVEWIGRNVRAGDAVYDIGANVGSYTLIAAAAAAGQAQVVAIEPGFANFAALCENVIRNRLETTVLPLPLVLGESTRPGLFGYRTTIAGAGMHSLDGTPGRYEQPVLVFSLDELIERFDLPQPTLIKLDVDGAEAAVLAGASETLRRPELRSLVVEIEHCQTERVTHLLRQSGLALVDRFDQRAGEPLPGVWYGIFERAAS